MRIRNFIWIGVAVLLIAAVIPASAVTRTVLCEAYTQWNCGPCAAWNPTEHSVTQGLGRDTVVVVKYHVWWPGANNDPFFLWNTAENTARTNFYGINAVPDGYIDGTTRVTRSGATFRSQILSRRAIPAPCTIQLTAATALNSNTVEFSGTISAVDSALAAPNTKLFVALISNETQATGGSNGESVFYNAFRDLYPNSSGETIQIALGANYEFEGTLNRDPGWTVANMSVVAWVQNYSTRWVHQAGWTRVNMPPYAARTESGDPRQLITPADGGEALYYIMLYNLGTANDTYTVSVAGDLPTGWTRSVEATGVPANPNSIQVNVNAQSNVLLSMRVNPNGNAGSATAGIDVVSNNDPNVTSTEMFRIMAGLDILLVDDDNGGLYGHYESYFESMLTAVAPDVVWGRWDVAQDALDGNMLEGVDLLIWFTGSCPNGQTLNFTEQSLLEVYMTNGGSLLLTGQGIAFDLRLSSFLPEYLHTTHVQPLPGGRNILGIAGEPLSDGLNLSIFSGEGANNQTRQNAILPADEMATVIWDYSGEIHHAGVRVQTENYRAIFLGFGMEAISSIADRNTVMGRSVGWLLRSSSSDERPDLNPAEFTLDQNYPNPFNPVTTIPYMLPERAAVSLRVFDLLGREVAELVTSVQEPGAHAATWDASGVSSGLYFYRLEAHGTAVHQATRKLMLLK